MGQLKILVVGDEARIRKLVKGFLQVKGFSVVEAANEEETVDIFSAQKDVALILLDVMMPKVDGWEVCEAIRQYSQVPITVLMVRSEERDRLQGSSLGVNGHISEPFSLKILVARVEAVLRRSEVVSSNMTDMGSICINEVAHQMAIDGEPADLSYEEFELLTYSVGNQGLMLSREEILGSAWDYDYFSDARTIDTHMEGLRSKLGSKEDYIKTIWGMGYKFEVET